MTLDADPSVNSHPAEVRGILLDIEGTTSSISFVYDVMFPFVRKELSTYLDQHWDTIEINKAVSLIAEEAGQPAMSREQVEREVHRLMDADVKSTGLKQLQGLIWKNGFESGELVAHVYDDVRPALERWEARRLDLRIYSSGSVDAQRLFFGNCIAGNLLPFFSGHYDTNTGPKREKDSYLKIATDFRIPGEEILFISDVVAELDAAAAAGMQTKLSIRPGNHVQAEHNHPCVFSFDEVE